MPVNGIVQLCVRGRGTKNLAGNDKNRNELTILLSILSPTPPLFMTSLTMNGERRPLLEQNDNSFMSEDDDDEEDLSPPPPPPPSSLPPPRQSRRVSYESMISQEEEDEDDDSLSSSGGFHHRSRRKPIGRFRHGSLDFERIVNDYSIQAHRDRLLDSEHENADTIRSIQQSNHSKIKSTGYTGRTANAVNTHRVAVRPVYPVDLILE